MVVGDVGSADGRATDGRAVMTADASIVFCSKSTWKPAIRREHALAQQAADQGIRTVFIEQPSDVRCLRSRAGAGVWLRGFREPRPSGQTQSPNVFPRSTIVPGHRGGLAQQLETRLLRSTLSHISDAASTVVAMLPWQWEAVAQAPAGQRVFDCTDDWSTLIPDRAEAIRAAYLRVADQADSIIVVTPALAELFPDRTVHVVRNGTPENGLSGAPTLQPGNRRMVYVGTLSERFDLDLVREVLALLPSWRLDLYGQCRYSGAGDRPSVELQQLLEGPLQARVRWHGVVERDRLSEVLDAGDVLILPNKPSVSAGQSSMKTYDYAARGRPIVTTYDDSATEQSGPPGLRVASTARSFADAVASSLDEAPHHARARVDWARSHTWSSRWNAWLSAAMSTSMRGQQQ